ncbi:MAG TPA: hypothetical protein VL401_00510 [Alphaproteobacteria bacterium]|jgi:hypothetical protein|nr:hypothetical protein [Alphaproteobacteria bacterium]
MESIIKLDNLGSKKDLIMDSFVVGAGSLPAQALFIKGFASYLEVDYVEVSGVFRETIKNLGKEVNSIFKEMSVLHHSNKEAKKTTAEVFKYDKGIPLSQTLAGQVPIELEIRRFFLNSEKEISEKRESIEEAMSKAFGKPREERNFDLKAINAAIGTYDEMEWWENMPKEEKEQLINKGKELLGS